MTDEFAFRMGPRQAERNLHKHGIHFTDAAGVLHDPLRRTMRDLEALEERFLTVGMDARGRVLVVVYTWRGEAVRIISARRAEPRERREYMEET